MILAWLASDFISLFIENRSERITGPAAAAAEAAARGKHWHFDLFPKNDFQYYTLCHDFLNSVKLNCHL